MTLSRVSGGEVPHVLECLDRRHQRAAPIDAKPALQVLDPERLLNARVVAGGEVVRELGLEITSIHHDEHRGVVERPVPAKLLASEDHGERLSRALRMPDKASAILGLGRLARE